MRGSTSSALPCRTAQTSCGAVTGAQLAKSGALQTVPNAAQCSGKLHQAASGASGLPVLPVDAGHLDPALSPEVAAEAVGIAPLVDAAVGCSRGCRIAKGLVALQRW